MGRNPAIHVLPMLGVLSSLVVFSNCGGSSSMGGGTKLKALTQLSVHPPSPTLAKGTILQLTATAVYNDGTTQDVTNVATWQTSDATIIKVSNGGSVSAVNVGSAQVSAKYQGVNGTDPVIVSEAALVSIAVTPSPTLIPVGVSQQLTATGTFSDESTRDLTQSATWNSSGSSIATVNSTGTAIAKAIGSATISAAIGSTAGSTQVTVTPPVPVALNILPGTISITLGSSRQLKATAIYSDGSTHDATAAVQWTSDAADIVSVDSHGLSVGEEVGDATISAVEQSLTATAHATVTPLALTHYFDLATAQSSNLDPTVFLANPGLVPSGLCSMFYVFDEKQEMSECCGCRIPDSALLMLSLEKDLTGNPLTGIKPNTGSIKVVSSDLTSNPQCDPSSLTPTGLVHAWGTNVRTRSDGTSQFVETEFTRVPLATTESTTLANSCSAVQKLGSGHGICSCGTGK